jgi:hypothetical protein
MSKPSYHLFPCRCFGKIVHVRLLVANNMHTSFHLAWCNKRIPWIYQTCLPEAFFWLLVFASISRCSSLMLLRILDGPWKTYTLYWIGLDSNSHLEPKSSRIMTHNKWSCGQLIIFTWETNFSWYVCSSQRLRSLWSLKGNMRALTDTQDIITFDYWWILSSEFLALVEQDNAVQAKLFMSSLRLTRFLCFHPRTGYKSTIFSTFRYYF